MSKLVAVQGCTITYTVNGGTVSVNASIIAANSKASSRGSKLHKNKITINVLSGTSVVLATPPAGASSGTGSLTLPGTIDINGTSTKSKLESQKIVLEGDEGSASFTFAFPASWGSTPVTSSVTIKAKVTSAGQSVVKAT